MPFAKTPIPDPPRPGGARPSRGARWGIGLAAAAMALFVGIVTGAVAVGQAVGGAGECVSDPGAPRIFCFDDDLTQEAVAKVVDVESIDELGESEPTRYIDLDYTTVEGEDVRATGIPWPSGVAEPVRGGTVRIAYDPADPEFAVGSAEALEAARSQPDPPDDGPAAALLWTTGLSSVLAGILLLVTIIWARRAPRPERPAPTGWYGSPYGYPVAPPGYPQPYPQPYPYPQPHLQPYPYPQPPPAPSPPPTQSPAPAQPPPSTWDMPG